MLGERKRRFSLTQAALGKLALALLVILVFALSSAQANAARGRPYVNPANRTLVADNGALLRGPQTSTETGTVPSMSSLLAIKNLGCNALHCYAERSDYGYAAGAKSNAVDTLVRMTRTNGLYLIITIGNGGGATDGFTTNFWNFYAGRYANETHVLYEIHNEASSGGPSSAAVITMQTNCYRIIRSAAPDTPILLFSYMAFSNGAAVVQDLNALGGVVAWTNAAIAFHGYGSGGAKSMRTCLQFVLDAGYPCFQTEFYRWPWGLGNFHLGDGASMYQDVTETGMLERMGVSWFTFVSLGLIQNDARFKNLVANAGILWIPDYGAWPSGSRGTYGNEGEPWWTTNLSSTLRIQVENFDDGGPGIAYNDTTSGNSGGAYRTASDVDIESTTDTGGGYEVGWLAPGEWLQYTIYINDPGLFDLKLRVASAVATNSLSVLFGGTDVTGTITFPGTGGNQVWTTLTNVVFLTPGQQIMQINPLSSGFKLNWFELSPVSVGVLTNGAYKLINLRSGKALEVAGAATTNGASLDQADYAGASHQKWTLTHKGGGQYLITSAQTGKAIDEASYAALSGDYIHTWTSANTSNQRWLLMPANSGYYRLLSANSGLALGTAGGATTNGATIVQGEYSGGTHQQWSVLAPEAPNSLVPTNLTATVNGRQLVLSWPTDHIGWHLQVQTNSLVSGLDTNWTDLTSTVGVNRFTNQFGVSPGAVFYRLAYP